MEIKLITPVTTEPITLAQAKLNLRLDSVDLIDEITPVQTITPGHYAIGPITGSTVDTLGYTSMAVELAAGTCAGTLNVSLQDSPDTITWTTVASFPTVTAANDNLNYTLAYTGRNRYLRVIATVTVGACDFGSSILEKTPLTPEDDLIAGLITVAREMCEAFTGRAMATQTWEYILDEFPYDKNYVDLPFPPVQQVLTATWRDAFGTITTMVEGTNYITNYDTEPGKIALPYCTMWPLFTPWPTGAVRIRFTTGYGSATTIPVPSPLMQGMLLLIGDLYENRVTSAEVRSIIELPWGTKALWWPYRLIRF